MLAHLGGYVPHLEAMWAHLGAMLAHLRGYVGRSWGYVGPSWGLWVPMLTYLEPHVRCLCKNMLNVTGPKNTVNYRGFCRHAHPTGGRRQGPNYVGPSWGLCWPILRAMWAQLGAMLTQLGAMLAYREGYVGRSWGLCRPILRPMLAHVDPCGAKRSEKWEQPKNTVKRRIFWGSAAYLGAMWAYLGAMLAHLGAMLAHLGAMLAPLGAMLAHLEAYVGPSWGYVGPSWGLCWPILRPLLAQVDPSWATKAEKWEKMGRAQNTVKRGGFWWYAVGGVGRRQGARPLSPTERRETPSAMPRPGGPWPGLWGLRLTSGRRQKQTRQPERALVLLLLADVGPIWAQVCPCLGPRLAHVAHILA